MRLFFVAIIFTNERSKQFILISENDSDEKKPHIMPVWSIKNRALKVRDEDSIVPTTPVFKSIATAL
jgi:hypothetical protein